MTRNDMTFDDATPEQALASAYLDGNLTGVERATVEASPELLALVASMRHAATMIAVVPSPSAAIRDAGIAAALAEFDVLGTSNPLSTGNPLAAGQVVSLASRRRWPTKVLTAAAAVVLIGVVGISVLRSGQDSNSDTVSLAPDTKRSDTSVAEGAAGNAQPATASDDVVLQSVAPALEIDDPQDLLTLTPATPLSADAPTADTTAAAGEATPSPERFDSYNVNALACMGDTQVFLADISYRGMLAIAVRDTVTGVTEAIDGNCTVLARVNP